MLAFCICILLCPPCKAYICSQNRHFLEEGFANVDSVISSEMNTNTPHLGPFLCLFVVELYCYWRFVGISWVISNTWILLQGQFGCFHLSFVSIIVTRFTRFVFQCKHVAHESWEFGFKFYVLYLLRVWILKIHGWILEKKREYRLCIQESDRISECN